MAALLDSFLRLPWRPDRRPVYDWASEYVTLPGMLARSGKFDISTSRHFIAPFDALVNDIVREVNVMAPPRSGKTLIADIFVPWLLANDPGSVLFLFNTDDQAKEHCETRQIPLLASCAPVQGLLPTDRHKNRTQEIVFPDGHMLKVCGAAISNLQAKGFRYVIEDECWQYKPGIMQEARARMGDFERDRNNKHLCISQGGVDGSEWDQQFAKGSLREWSIKCESCGLYQPPVWSDTRDDGSRFGIVYDAVKRADGSYDVGSGAASVRYVCKGCGHAHANSSTTLARWNESGRYDNDGLSECVSFHWNEIVWRDWSGLVEKWLMARNAARNGSYEPLIAFFQKQLATHKSERTAMDFAQPIQRVEIDTKAVDGEHVFMSVDVQKDQLLYVTVRAWAADGRSRRLYRGKVYGFAELERVRTEFTVQRSAVLIDAGHWRYEVFSIAADNGYICTIGKDQMAFSHTVLDPRTKARKVHQKPWSPMFYGDPDIGKQDRRDERRAKAFYLAVPIMADWIQRLIDLGKWTEPKIDPKVDEEEAEYGKQMGAESKQRVRDRDGRARDKWVNLGERDNHYLDCGRMQVFAAMAKGLIAVESFGEIIAREV